MADDIMKLRALLNKNLDDDLLRELIGLTAHRLMELEIGGLTTAAHGNRGPERLDHRNGHRSHVWEIPAQRDGGKRDVHRTMLVCALAYAHVCRSAPAIFPHFFRMAAEARDVVMLSN